MTDERRISDAEAAMPEEKPLETHFEVGDKVRKVGGDYSFDGTVVAAFMKLSGLIRYVVEDDRGVLHIYAARNLEERRE